MQIASVIKALSNICRALFGLNLSFFCFFFSSLTFITDIRVLFTGVQIASVIKALSDIRRALFGPSLSWQCSSLTSLMKNALILKTLYLICCPSQLKEKVRAEITNQANAPTSSDSDSHIMMIPGRDKAYVSLIGGFRAIEEDDMNEFYLQ